MGSADIWPVPPLPEISPRKQALLDILRATYTNKRDAHVAGDAMHPRVCSTRAVLVQQGHDFM